MVFVYSAHITIPARLQLAVTSQRMKGPFNDFLSKIRIQYLCEYPMIGDNNLLGIIQ